MGEIKLEANMETHEARDKAVIVVATLIAAALIVMIAIARSAEGGEMSPSTGSGRTEQGRGEYYRYKDARGTLTFSNLWPAAGAKEIETYQLKDVTWEEVHAARRAETLEAINTKLGELNEKVEKMGEILRSAQDDSRKVQDRQQAPTIITTIGGTTVTVRPVVVVRKGK